MSGPVLDAVAAVVGEAGQLALSRIGGDYRRWDKSPGHPVCDVDLAVDEFLRERLSQIEPGAAWLSEETVDDPVRLRHRLVWIVDPIDGTRDYLRQRSGWCVSVALIEDESPIFGALFAPMRDEIWIAQRGQGATRNGVKLAVSRCTQLSGARVPADALGKADRDLLPVQKPNSIALRIAKVAAGEADFVASMRLGKEWDIAAAVLIASEAGAAVSDGRGDALRFNTAHAQAFGVIASAPDLHRAVVERFARA